MKNTLNHQICFLFLLSLGIIFGSCQQDSNFSSETIKHDGELSPRSTSYLYHTITVDTDLNGYYYFTDSLSVVEA